MGCGAVWVLLRTDISPPSSEYYVSKVANTFLRSRNNLLRPLYEPQIFSSYILYDFINKFHSNATEHIWIVRTMRLHQNL
jgi:hypothetical protein